MRILYMDKHIFLHILQKSVFMNMFSVFNVI